MKHYIVQLELSAEEVLQYYNGQAAAVRARAHTGAIVQFPAAALRRFVEPTGVKGLFRLSVTGGGRLTALDRLD